MLPVVALAASDAAEFGARRFPALPVLELDAEPALCRPLLEAYRATFLWKARVVSLDAMALR